MSQCSWFIVRRDEGRDGVQCDRESDQLPIGRKLCRVHREDLAIVTWFEMQEWRKTHPKSSLGIIKKRSN